MSKFSKFMQANKTERPNEMYAATRSLTDENGIPLLWEFRHLTTREHEKLRDSCTYEVPIKGKPGVFRNSVRTSEYLAKVVVASCVYPDLYDSELQDSYGVKTPEELLYAMVDEPGEYQDLMRFVQRMNGFDTSMDDLVDKAKN